jgi:hypothetical protein
MLSTIGHANRVRQIASPATINDLFVLSKMDIGAEALIRLDLLKRVVNHKKLFFASAWASYDTARAGTFHLVPADHRIEDLRSDYKEMKAMIFGAYPEWDEIIEGLTALERRINRMNLKLSKVAKMTIICRRTYPNVVDFNSLKAM